MLLSVYLSSHLSIWTDGWTYRCTCAAVRACMHACMRPCVCACVRVCVRTYVRIMCVMVVLKVRVYSLYKSGKGIGFKDSVRDLVKQARKENRFARKMCRHNTTRFKHVLLAAALSF